MNILKYLIVMKVCMNMNQVRFGVHSFFVNSCYKNVYHYLIVDYYEIIHIFTHECILKPMEIYIILRYRLIMDYGALRGLTGVCLLR